MKGHTKNRLEKEYALAKQLGFEATSSNSLIRNPIMRLANDTCLVWMAGGLIGLTTTSTFFGKGLYLDRWKSSDGNKPWATMTTVRLDKDGKGKHTEIYYRLANKDLIEVYAKRRRCREDEIVIDHINHMRGDNRDFNLRLADAAQNNMNRSKVKITKAFYTVDDFLEKRASGEWLLAKQG